jgi:diacylglycerol kinase family enzyme
MTQATKITVTTKARQPFELDGGARPKASTLRVRVVPNAVTIRVPSAACRSTASRHS